MPRIPDSVRRSRNAAGARHQSGPPGASEPLPLGVAGGHQLRRLDDLGTMTAGHQFLHLDDLHTSSFARTEIGRASCKGKSVDLGGRRIIKKKKKKDKRWSRVT